MELYRRLGLIVLVLILLGCVNWVSCLRNNLFGSLNPQLPIPIMPTGMITAVTSALTTTTSTASTTTSTNTPTSQNVPPVVVNSGIGSVLNQVFRKVSLEEINKDIKDIMQKEASNNNLGQCIFTDNPYIDLGYRDTDYSKCKKYLLSTDTWLSKDAINTLIQNKLADYKLSIPSKKKLDIPSLETLFRETFLQVCVKYFIDLTNSGLLYFDNQVCTGTKCHEQFNSLCSFVTGTYGKSAFVLGGPSVQEVIQRICQESRRQIAAKHPTLVSSPADIRSDNTAVEAAEPIPT
ncbi:putative signal peptide-containing protein [Cryptosporidium canis]|uniref:Signal peptide-containing protein n=1 Tax=Cryptosporidium canis TaxID=195482 RepID=A0A9D5DIR3_9CRYT|nr:putative signal peptide-containing protein [Cryptosporidium canis]